MPEHATFAPKPTPPQRKVPTAPPAVGALQRLQGGAGNAAVTALVAQRLAESPGSCPTPPVAPVPMAPAADPKFAAATADVKAKAAGAKAHPPARAEVKAAQDAAVAPPDDKEAQAKAAHTGKMDAAKPGNFDKAAFVAAVKAAIAAKAPKNLDEADKFAGSGKADQVKNEVAGKVAAGKEQSVKAVADTAKATPDAAGARDKPVAALPPVPEAKTPAPPNPTATAPKPAPAEQLRLGAGTCQSNATMAEAGVTDEQLAKSNEPEFTNALDAKKAVAAHDAAGPAQVRQQEGQVLAAATAHADASAKTGLAAMSSAKGAALQKAMAGKQTTKSKDEDERKRIAGEIKKIFDATKTEVETILGGIDAEVTKRFEAGEAKAKEAFTADHQKRMWDYKVRRYTGPLGPSLWLKDLFLKMPPEADNLFLESKKVYETKMAGVIDDVADFIGKELTRAKDRVAKGRADVQKFVVEQPANLQKIAGQAAGEIGSQFDELEKSVDEKQNALVDDLAEKYSEARDAVDAEIKKLQAENQGLVGQAVAAVTGAVDTIKKLKDMLLGVLARAANAVDKIIKDPMKFLENFVNAVKAGIQKFLGNIVEHLKKGLQGWLFGALADAGIEIPEKFDLRGVIRLLLSVFGLTWTSVRGRIVKQVGEPVMGKLETGVDFIKAIVTEGLPGAWKWVVGKLSDLKDQVMGQIRDFVITKIITAGITWLISLLNPAAAFVKACKMIYDAVMWFVDNAERLEQFADSVLDSVESIADGGVGAVAGLIENTLARAVPMLISGLASLLGLGGVGAKIASLLEKVRGPVGKAVDWLVAKAVKHGKKLMTKLKNSKAGKFVKGVKDKARSAYDKGKAKAKALYEKGKAKVKAVWEKGKAKVKGAVAGVSGGLKALYTRLRHLVFRERFTVAGESHTLFTRKQAPQVVFVASDPKPVSSLGDAEVDKLHTEFASTMNEYASLVASYANAPDTPESVDKLERDAARLRDKARELQGRLLAKVRAAMSASGPGRHAPGIGDVGPHSSKLASLRPKDKGKRVPVWMMESEHVIPDGMLRAALMSLDRTRKVAKVDTGYHDQTTVMIYRAAAASKTSIDQDLIRRMRNVVGMIRFRAGGDDDRLRKGASSRPSDDKRTKKDDWRNYVRDQFDRRVLPTFLALAFKASERTKAAVKAEQLTVGDARGVGAPPMATDAQIDSAYNAQRTHMLNLIEQQRAAADAD